MEDLIKEILKKINNLTNSGIAESERLQEKAKSERVNYEREVSKLREQNEVLNIRAGYLEEKLKELTERPGEIAGELYDLVVENEGLRADVVAFAHEREKSRRFWGLGFFGEKPRDLNVSKRGTIINVNLSTRNLVKKIGRMPGDIRCTKFVNLLESEKDADLLYGAMQNSIDSKFAPNGYRVTEINYLAHLRGREDRHMITAGVERYEDGRFECFEVDLDPIKKGAEEKMMIEDEWKPERGYVSKEGFRYVLEPIDSDVDEQGEI